LLEFIKGGTKVVAPWQQGQTKKKIIYGNIC